MNYRSKARSKARNGTSGQKLLTLRGFSPHKVNGLYQLREERLGGRPSWISSRGMVLWYNKRNSWWMVCPKAKVGTGKCYVYCFDYAEDPTRTTGVWKYFDSKAVGRSKFKEEIFASVVSAKPKLGSPLPRGGHRRVQSFAQNRGFGYGASRNAVDVFSECGDVKKGRPRLQNFGMLNGPYSQDRRNGRRNYDPSFSHRARQSSAVGSFASPRKRGPSSTRMRRGNGHQRHVSIDNVSDRTLSTLVPYSPHLTYRSSRPVPSRTDRNSRGVKPVRLQQQDRFPFQQRQMNPSGKEPTYLHRFNSPVNSPAPTGASSSRSVVRSRDFPRIRNQKEYIGLKLKHEGGIFVTKYPFRDQIFARPKKTRVEIVFIEDQRRPAVKWSGKMLFFDEMRGITIGIKSETFRRFENRLMRKKHIQPNQCVSVHSAYRTLDFVLKSSDDAQDFKRYLEINLEHPLMLQE